MAQAAKMLLSDVTRLLILADMIDVFLLLKSLSIVSECCMHVIVNACDDA